MNDGRWLALGVAGAAAAAALVSRAADNAGSTVRVGPRFAYAKDAYLHGSIREVFAPVGSNWMVRINFDDPDDAEMYTHIRWACSPACWSTGPKPGDRVKLVAEDQFALPEVTRPSKSGSPAGSTIRVGPRFSRSAEQQQAEYDTSSEGLAGRRIAIAHRLMRSVRHRVETVGRDDRWGPNGHGTDLWRELITGQIGDEDVPAMARAIWSLRLGGLATGMAKLVARYRTRSGLNRSVPASDLLDWFAEWNPRAKVAFLSDFANLTLPNGLDEFERSVAVALPDDLTFIENWVRSVEDVDRVEGF